MALEAQLHMIAAALLAGACCGAVYDVLRAIRRASGRRWVELLLDALFSALVCALLFVLVTAVVRARLRGFLPLSMLAGGLLWHATAGRLFRRALRWSGAAGRALGARMRTGWNRLARLLRGSAKKGKNWRAVSEKSRKN